jgi:hypothetical protein
MYTCVEVSPFTGSDSIIQICRTLSEKIFFVYLFTVYNKFCEAEQERRRFSLKGVEKAGFVSKTNLSYSFGYIDHFINAT